MRPSCAAIACAALLAASCGSTAATPSCVTDLPRTCAPLYTPDFHHLYTRTLHPTCAQPGASCHASAGDQGGLTFEDEDDAYDLLLGEGGAPAVVVPDDPACSVLVERLTSSDPSFQMPPGSPLSPAEQCVVVTWIRDGAKR